MSDQKLKECFASALGINKDLVLNSLQYNSIPEWDSVGHMSLVAELEDCFDIMLDTDDIIDMSSLAKAKDILKKYNIDF
jgi:acyl carrier protein